jgi:hypothetical protein
MHASKSAASGALDCDRFEGCAVLDPVFARTLGEVAAESVMVLVYACEIGQRKITLRQRIPWKGEAWRRYGPLQASSNRRSTPVNSIRMPEILWSDAG